MKKMIGMIIVACVGLFPALSMATDVGGIIDTDTTWDLSGSPYNIIADVQIAENVTLAVDPGVIISNGKIQVWGTFSAIGTDSSMVILNSVYIKGEDITSIVNIEFSEFNGGSLDHHDDGYLTLRNSKLQDFGPFSIHDSLGANIEKNIFINSSGIRVGHNNDVKVYIRNNIFYQQISEFAVQNFTSYQTSETIVEYNSFLSTDRIALMLPPDYDNAKMTATNNYWNTTDTDVIDSMIYDRNDDLNVINYIGYIPILTEPHPDTPIPDLNQSPTSNCGADQVVFDEVTLDGNASYDPDGLIDLYEWTLQHRTNPANNRNASGDNPTVHNLGPGFYDVCLTVTDNDGAIGLDCSLLAAAGSCFCTASTIHIEEIEPDLLKANKGEKHGQALVKVIDDCGKPVSGVTVYGTFSGDFTESISGVTGGDGNALLITTTSTKKKPAFTFCVDDVINGTLPYCPSDNVETCDSF